MSLYRRRKRRTEINIVPLVDVMTVLIFFFLMSMRFDSLQALSITPPTADSAGRERSAGNAVAAVTRDGKFYLNSREVSREALVQHLENEGKKLPGSYVLIVADEQALTRDTVFIVDQANKAGLAPRLQTRPSR
jgi:biopolymer transport protein ExbD